MYETTSQVVGEEGGRTPAQQHRRQRSDASTSSRAPRATIASSTALGVDTVLPTPQPAVYWNDAQSKATSTGPPQTFFDESTPPPSPSYATADTRNLSTAYTSEPGTAAAKYTAYDYRYDHVAPPAPIPSTKTGGVRKKVLWSVMGVALLLIIGLAVGLGVGLTVGDGDEESDEGGNQDGASPLSTTTVTQLSSTIITSTIPTATVTIPYEPSEACPAANNSIFEVPNSDKTFRRTCGVDYFPSGGTTDLATVFTASAQDCIINCAGFDKCTACSWGVVPGNTYRDNHHCYLKTDLGEPSEVRDGWDFAIMM